MLWAGQNWQPTRVERVIETFPTSTRPAKVMTDAGVAFLKGMGNPAGNGSLACEVVAGELAHLIGLRIPEFAVVQLDLEIPMADLGSMELGPAFASKALPGFAGDGSVETLQQLRRPADVAKLVLFDSWIRNHDRYPPDGAFGMEPNRDNIFLTPLDRKLDLVALDHSHCFTDGDLDDELATNNVLTDDRICGLFPEFGSLLAERDVRLAAQAIESVEKATVQEIVNSLPPQWGPMSANRLVWVEVIIARARLIADTVPNKLIQQLGLGLE